MTANPSLHLLLPGPADQRTGGYLYDARMAEELRGRGWRIEVHALDGRFPDPDPRGEGALRTTLAGLPEGARVLVDGLALAALPGADPEGGLGARVRLLALVHHPLQDEEGLPAETAKRLGELEMRALARCEGVVVTSPFTRERVAELGVPPARIRVVEPGTRPAPLASGPRAGDPPALLCVGSVAPRKGQDVLVDALTRIRDLPWRCHCAGSLDRERGFAEEVLRRVRAEGLGERIAFTGELGEEALDALYDSATLLVLPSRYEGYGMVLAEALARGLPVVSTTGGAIPGTVPEGAGVLVPPGDPEALAAVLRELLASEGADPAPGLARLREGARARRGELRDWPAAGERFAGALLELAPEGKGERFAASWLALREPVDHAARAEELLGPLREAWSSRGWTRVLDLGCGTGSNLRYLAPRLPRGERWTLVDHDASLLARVEGAPAGVELRRVCGDLEAVGLPLVEEADLVTASALLDLVGSGWLDRLVRACAARGCGVFLTLTWDGTVRWSPPADPLDAVVLARVHAHQGRDKGTGPALGPSAGAEAERRFREAGFEVHTGPSPWRLGTGEAELVRHLVEGWVAAASEEAPGEAAELRAWGARRMEAFAGGGVELTVGHLDLLALP